jgi:hypothetical protein
MNRNVFFVIMVLFLLASCTTDSALNVEEPTIGLQVVERAMPGEGNIVDAKRGAEMWLAVGPVNGVGEYPANGVTQAHLFEDGTYLLTAQVNIAMAPDGYFYEAWIIEDKEQSRGGSPISLGHLRSRIGDVRHNVIFESGSDLHDRLNIVITLEADDGDTAMRGNIVAEGALKERTR